MQRARVTFADTNIYITDAPPLGFSQPENVSIHHLLQLTVLHRFRPAKPSHERTIIPPGCKFLCDRMASLSYFRFFNRFPLQNCLADYVMGAAGFCGIPCP